MKCGFTFFRNRKKLEQKQMIQQSTSSFRGNNNNMNNNTNTAAVNRVKRQNSMTARQLQQQNTNTKSNNNNNNNANTAPSSPSKNPNNNINNNNNNNNLQNMKNSTLSSSNSNNLSNSELREMRETFEAFDEDHSGTIDVEELQHIMKHLGHNISERDSAVLLQQVSNDPNRDGLLFDELVNLLMLFKETAQYKLLETDDSAGQDNNMSRHDEGMYDHHRQSASNNGISGQNNNHLNVHYYNNSNSNNNSHYNHNNMNTSFGGVIRRSNNNLSNLRNEDSGNNNGNFVRGRGGSFVNIPNHINNIRRNSTSGRRTSSTSSQTQQNNQENNSNNNTNSPSKKQHHKRRLRTHSQQQHHGSSDDYFTDDEGNENSVQEQEKPPSWCASCCYNLISPMLPFLNRARPTDSFPTTFWHLMMMFWAAYFWFFPLLIDTNSSLSYMHSVVKGTIVPTAIGSAFLVLDIFVQMFLVSDPEELLDWSVNKNYMWKLLWLDIISAIPFEWILLPDYVNPQMSQIPCRVLMHLRLVKLISAAYNYFGPSQVVRSSRVYIFVHAFFVPVVKSSILFVCMVHLLAVIWCAVSKDATYSLSMLFAAYTVSGVGYGMVDFVSTTEQRLLASAYCLLAPINVSIVVGSTITLLSQSNVAISNRHGVVETLRICEMSSYNKAVTADILGYREHLNTISVSASHGDITDCLPDALKRNITLFVKTRLIQKTAIFQMAHRTTQVALAQSLEDVVLRPGQVVCYVNETVSDLYLISHGKIALITDDGEISEFIYGGACINDIGLLRGHVRQQLTARAVCHCEIFVLTRKAFSNVCKKFPVFGKAVLEVRSQLKAIEVARKREVKAVQRMQKLMKKQMMIAEKMKDQQRAQAQAQLQQQQKANGSSSVIIGANFAGVKNTNVRSNTVPLSPRQQSQGGSSSENNNQNNKGSGVGIITQNSSSVLNVFSGDHNQSASLVAEPSSFYKSYPRSHNDNINENNNNNPLSSQAAHQHVAASEEEQQEMKNIVATKNQQNNLNLDAPNVESRKGSTFLIDELEQQQTNQNENNKNIASSPTKVVSSPSRILEPENSARHVGATYVFQMLTALSRNHNIDFSTIVSMQKMKNSNESNKRNLPPSTTNNTSTTANQINVVHESSSTSEQQQENTNQNNNNNNVKNNNNSNRLSPGGGNGQNKNHLHHQPPPTIEQQWDMVEMMSPQAKSTNNNNSQQENPQNQTFDYDSLLYQNSSQDMMTASTASTFVQTIQGGYNNGQVENNKHNNNRVAAVTTQNQNNNNGAASATGNNNNENKTKSSRLAALTNEALFGGQVDDSDASTDDYDHDGTLISGNPDAPKKRRKDKSSGKKKNKDAQGKSLRNQQPSFLVDQKNKNQSSPITTNVVVISNQPANEIDGGGIQRSSIDGSMISYSTATENNNNNLLLQQQQNQQRRSPGGGRGPSERKRSKSGGGVTSNNSDRASSNGENENDDDDDDDDEEDDDDDDAWSRDEDDERSAIYELLVETSDEDIIDLTDLVATQASQGEQGVKAEKSELAACEREMMRIEKLLLFLEKKMNLHGFSAASRQGSGASSGGGVGGVNGGTININRNNLYAIGSQATLLTAMSRGGSNRFSSKHSTTSHRSNQAGNNNNNNPNSVLNASDVNNNNHEVENDDGGEDAELVRR